MKPEICRKILGKCRNIKFHITPPSRSRFVPCVQRDGQTNRQPDSHDETSISLVSIFWDLLKAEIQFFSIKVFIFPPILTPLGLCFPQLPHHSLQPSHSLDCVPVLWGYSIDGVSWYFVAGKRKNFHNENNNVHDLGSDNWALIFWKGFILRTDNLTAFLKGFERIH